MIFSFEKFLQNTKYLNVSKNIKLCLKFKKKNYKDYFKLVFFVTHSTFFN